MIHSPLLSTPLFHIGPIGVSAPVVTTWAIMALLAGGAALCTRRLSLIPSKIQTVLELLVSDHRYQIRDTMQAEPQRYRALIGTLFLFILVSNWSSLLPGVEPPTAHIETDAALALIVFCATIFYGVRTRGLLRLSRHLRRTDLDHDPAQRGRADHADLLADGAPVRQRDERRVRRRYRAVARRAVRADPADGARPADRRRAGLHLHGARDGLHRRGARERSTTTSAKQQKGTP